MRAVLLAALVPVKAFGAAKQRLAGVLSPVERHRLARHMAEIVVDAGAGLAVHVVCDDDEVAAWAESRGATVLWRPGAGLNAAVTEGVAQLAATGFDHVVVAHSDLPLARSLAGVARSGVVTLVPDRTDDGTNVVALPSASPFVFAYGPGSFRRHLASAAELALDVRVVRDPLLAHDVDTPSDLDDPRIQEALSSLRTNPDSRR